MLEHVTLTFPHNVLVRRRGSGSRYPPISWLLDYGLSLFSTSSCFVSAEDSDWDPSPGHRAKFEPHRLDSCIALELINQSQLSDINCQVQENPAAGSLGAISNPLALFPLGMLVTTPSFQPSPSLTSASRPTTTLLDDLGPPIFPQTHGSERADSTSSHARMSSYPGH